MVGKTITLATGAKMPIIGLGTWQSKPEEVALAVETAIEAGYRHIDTAFAYQNEKAIGDTIQKLIKAGKDKREELFIVTKVSSMYHNRADVAQCLEKQLAELQLSYVDLYLIHSPISMEKDLTPGVVFPLKDGKLAWDKVDIVETWKGMEEVFKSGKAKAIGLSNFNSKQIQRICDSATVKPHNLQVECHAYWPQNELVEFCKKRNITVVAYGPIGSPGLKTFVRPGIPAKTDLPVLLEDPVVVSLAEKYKKIPAQILLRWLIQREIMPIPKSVTPSRIKENFQVFDFELSADDFTKLSNLSKRERLFKFDFPGALDHPEYPYKEPF